MFKNVNNRVMNSYFDKFLLIATICLIVFLFASYITDSFIIGLCIVALVISAIFFFTKKFYNKDEEKISKKDYMRTLLLEGKDYILEQMRKVFSAFYTTEIIKEGVTIEINGNRIIIYNGFKFNALNEEDVANAYRAAKYLETEEIYFFYNTANRRALTLSNYISCKAHLLSYKSFYRLAKKANVLPPKIKTKKPRRWGLIFKSVASYANIKYFLFAAVSTGLLSIVTPLRTYYLIFAIVNLILAIIIVIITSKQEKLIL